MGYNVYQRSYKHARTHTHTHTCTHAHAHTRCTGWNFNVQRGRHRCELHRSTNVYVGVSWLHAWTMTKPYNAQLGSWRYLRYSPEWFWFLVLQNVMYACRLKSSARHTSVFQSWVHYPNWTHNCLCILMNDRPHSSIFATLNLTWLFFIEIRILVDYIKI